MQFVEEFDRFAKSLPFRSPSVPVGHPSYGQIGECIAGRRFMFKGMTEREWNALMKDERRSRNYLSYLLNQRGAITTWDDILAARAAGKANDYFGYKASQTTVANAWSSFFRTTGIPGAGSFTNIPGGAVHTRTSSGAIPLTNPTTGESTYLLNFGTNHATGTNIVLLADLLVGAGNINTNATGNQTVNSTTQTRQYGSTLGEGIMMIFEVTTALGGTAANITVTYTNSAGTSGRSTTQAMTTSCIVGRTQPTAGGIVTPLQGDDIGVRSVETVAMSAAMGAGVIALMLYKPLLMIPTLSTVFFIERNTPSMLSGIIKLAADSSNVIGCLMVFVLTSSTSTGVQTYLLQAVNG